MRRHIKQVAVGAAALTAAVGAGGAIAATQLNPRQESQAVVNDAAEQLGVEPSELTAALKEALANRVDAAVQAARLTQAQGAELKERIRAGDVPLFGGPGFGHRGGPHHHFGHLDAAASYLGMTEANLRTALDGGKTLAQVARDRGKPVDGLVTALVNAERAELADAVQAGRLTDAQRDAMLSGIRARITRLVNGQGPPVGVRRFGPPPGAGAFEAPAPDLGSVA
jgi:hypothetical protein